MCDFCLQKCQYCTVGDKTTYISARSFLSLESWLVTICTTRFNTKTVTIPIHLNWLFLLSLHHSKQPVFRYRVVLPAFHAGNTRFSL